MTIWLIIIVKPVKKERQICLYRFYIWTRDGLLPYKNKRTSLFHLRTFQTPWKRYNICIQINKNTFSSDYIEKKMILSYFLYRIILVVFGWKTKCRVINISHGLLSMHWISVHVYQYLVWWERVALFCFVTKKQHYNNVIKQRCFLPFNQMFMCLYISHTLP